MNIVYGSLQNSSKSVRFDGTPIIEAFNRPDLLTYLPQFNFIPSGLTLKRVFQDFKISLAELEEHFPEFNGKSEAKVKHLSGGQRRLIEVYVIIKSKAQFSMLDEPFSHIMPLHINRIKEILAVEKLNKGFCITDHMYRELIDICDSLYVLADGKTHLTSSIRDIERLGYARV
jgi:ABC-type lipopolysaccharide export system ATPase subunit